MPSSNQVLGRAYVKVNGSLLKTHKGAKLDPGGVTRAPVVGNTVHGFAEEAKEPTLECEISVDGNFKLADLKDITDATVTFEADTGQVYVLRNAWIVDPPVMTDGEGGKVPLKFSGISCEEA
ncbi:MAG: phage tail tube protein [Rhodospirillales bacterium]|jgi:hypothetical protein|nr:phage tail tube protein [Rhodospirillales bacterium]